MVEAIVVPDIGEGVVSGKVVAVHIKVGERVEVEDTVVELETDKAVVEIPSPLSGKVVDVLAQEGQDLDVGAVIAKVETQANASDHPPAAPDAASPAEADPAEATETTFAARADEQPMTMPAEEKSDLTPEKPTAVPAPASPSIRRLARELGIDIHAVTGRGPGGRITEADIKTHVKDRQHAPVPGVGDTRAGAGEPVLPDFTRWGEIESVALETVRRLTAQSTAASWQTIPHVTQFDKADITGLDTFVRKNAAKVSQAGGKLTVTAILTKVCAAALKKFPRFNASIDLTHEQIIYKKYIHIGIAVDTPRGLLLPVIRHADTKSITQLAIEIVDLARRSRDKKIKRTELEGGTFSISNQGGIGGVGFTPIVLWPQVAILGVSRSAIEPKWTEGQVIPATVLPLSLSYDHRIIDGADAARFLRWICESLEQPLTLYLD